MLLIAHFGFLEGIAAYWCLWFTCTELLEHPLHEEPHEKQEQSCLLNSIAISGHVLSRVTHGANVPIPHDELPVPVVFDRLASSVRRDLWK